MKKINKKTKVISKRIRFLFVLLITVCSQQLYSQAIFQPGRILGEKNHLVVSGTVLKCDTSNQVHLKIFNNGQDDVSADFNLVITNTKTGKQVTKNVKITVVKSNQVLEGTCKGGSSNLVFTLPKGYDIGNVAIMINFNNL